MGINILGVSGLYHDSAACLLCDGEIIAAAQEERFTRVKHDQRFPIESIKYVLSERGITADQITHVVFYEKPQRKFDRLYESHLAFAPNSFPAFYKASSVWLKDKFFQKQLIIAQLASINGKKADWDKKLLFSEHHLSHASSAYYPSPFQNAVILTMDGVGEWATTSVAIGRGNELSLIEEIRFPHSIGLLYSAFTYYCGFKVNSGEYKLMGLAPYGRPIFADIIRDKLIDIKDDGSFHLDVSYFDYCAGLRMTNEKFNSIFGGLPRAPEAALTQREMDIAASIQAVTEEVVIKIARHAAKTTGETNLCLAGGVALNCVANGRLLREKIFEKIWIQPAAGDAGGAMGAALAAYYSHLNYPRVADNTKDSLKGSYLGPAYNADTISSSLKAIGGVFEKIPYEAVIEKTATYLADGKAIGWFQGRMEFGPRALGARSILADPRNPSVQKQLNLKIKYRESFRPFAPSILHDHLSEWFDCEVDSPYMLIVADVKSTKQIEMSDAEKNLFGIEKLNICRSQIPAVTHVDYSARIQTVDELTNPMYAKLLKKFYEKTGCPILVNTSFNIRGEPIVCTVADAFRCFMGSGLDVLVIENFILLKNDQTVDMENYLNEFELD